MTSGRRAEDTGARGRTAEHDQDVPGAADADARDPRDEARRRRRRAAVFGDVLPDSTSDERGPEPRERDTGEDWLRAQVPPHHG